MHDFNDATNDRLLMFWFGPMIWTYGMGGVFPKQIDILDTHWTDFIAFIKP